MSDQRLKIAVFIDFDNVEIGVKTTLGRQFDIGAVLEAIKERGEIITKVAYGDWKRAGDHGRAMSQHAVRLVQRVMTPGGDKNGADINLALDALEMAFTHAHINAFVIVGGDSDFITLVEKLKQYDRKVFVVGGRAFTSQVMQKNCTEFIAYENVAGGGAAVTHTSASSPPDRRRSGTPAPRARAESGASLEQALPLVKRALKVLADREVSPQLGLLKQTLLQLDSSFSERDYGVTSFRDFAEKLEKQGLVTLKHTGRTTVVELADEDMPASAKADAHTAEAHTAEAHTAEAHTADAHNVASSSVRAARSNVGSGFSPGMADSEEPADQYTGDGNLADGVALIRSILAEATTPPRWPMYVRQMKQFIRNARPDFDERRYGSILDLMRACQKDGLLRLERDRQGGLRVFASGPIKASAVPHGWSTIVGDEPPAVEVMPEPQQLLPPPSAAEPAPVVTQAVPVTKPTRARRKASATKNEELRTKNQEPRTKNEEPRSKSERRATRSAAPKTKKEQKGGTEGKEPRTRRRAAKSGATPGS